MKEDKWVNPNKKFRKIQCYHKSELMDFFTEYFDLSIKGGKKQFGYEEEWSLVDKKTKLYNNTTVKLKWYSEESYPSEITIDWFRGWMAKENNSIHLEWTDRRYDNENYKHKCWYIADYCKNVHIEISKIEVLKTIIDFITEHEKVSGFGLSTTRDITLTNLLK